MVVVIAYCDSFLEVFFFFFKQKTAYEMRISDWSSDVCSSDLSLMIDSGEKMGEIKEGHLADLLLVDGDPLADFSVLLNPDRLTLIMKNGEIYKNSSAAVQNRAAA